MTKPKADASVMNQLKIVTTYSYYENNSTLLLHDCLEFIQGKISK